MPRYVILEHDHPELHWDFMLESGGVLRTWRLRAPPQPGHALTARQSFDHRLFYLEYEGPISGGRGRVSRWDGGNFSWQVEEPDRLAVHLEGQRLQGRAVLERVAVEEWSLVFSGQEPNGMPSPR